ncbi:MAG: cupin domain-containing protein [Candidatus Dactylopiibacterium sp.]|nr:cupin domain-containing protein [Candidatus Dactylopiibacterium sp.]
MTHPLPTLSIARAGTQDSLPGPTGWFTGQVRIDPLFTAAPPATGSGALVTFEPGARTDWHVHPLGQVLIVTAGCGRVQQWGAPAQTLHPGDVVSIPAGVKHWHGAAPATAMSHIALQEQRAGQVVEWLEKVSDAQYAPA